MKITTEAEYESALADLDKLLASDEHQLNDADCKKFQELCDALEGYEEIHYPIPAPSFWGRFTWWLYKKSGINI